MIATNATAIRLCDIEIVVAAQIPSRHLWVGTPDPIVITAMLKHGIRMLFAGTLKFSVAEYENLLGMSSIEYIRLRQRYPN